MLYNSEMELYKDQLLGHLEVMTKRLRLLPAERWDFTFAPAAPTPRTLAIHALEWLKCDRQHITNSDVTTHRPIPPSPTEPSEICDALDAETKEWERLLDSLTLEQMLIPSPQFGEFKEINTRGYIGHMMQNVIYKHGQFTTIFFALGLDGEEPYAAPFPNPIYQEVLGIQ